MSETNHIHFLISCLLSIVFFSFYRCTSSISLDSWKSVWPIGSLIVREERKSFSGVAIMGCNLLWGRTLLSLEDAERGGAEKACAQLQWRKGECAILWNQENWKDGRNQMCLESRDGKTDIWLWDENNRVDEIEVDACCEEADHNRLEVVSQKNADAAVENMKIVAGESQR